MRSSLDDSNDVYIPLEVLGTKGGYEINGTRKLRFALRHRHHHTTE